MRSGRIIYTNDIPVYAAFDEGAVAFPGSLHADVPAKLNERLLEGELDLSPISAFAYAQHAGRFALLPSLCIGSRKDVWSVLLVSRQHPSQLGGKRIFVTGESASGRNLLRVLLERRYGVRVRFEPTAEPLERALAGEPTLLIGDRAIDAQFAMPPDCVHDLGTLWHEWTGLDMVYAVWAVRREFLERASTEVAQALDALVASRAWGTDNAEAVLRLAQRTRPRPAGFYASYYATLNFDFDAAAQQGLQRFFDELLAAGAIADRVSSRPQDIYVAR